MDDDNHNMMTYSGIIGRSEKSCKALIQNAVIWFLALIKVSWAISDVSWSDLDQVTHLSAEE